MGVKKVPGGWAVVHGHAQKKGSKTDKPKGSVITVHKTKAEADAQHRAIMANQAKRKKGKK